MTPQDAQFLLSWLSGTYDGSNAGREARVRIRREIVKLAAVPALAKSESLAETKAIMRDRIFRDREASTCLLCGKASTRDRCFNCYPHQVEACKWCQANVEEGVCTRCASKQDEKLDADVVDEIGGF